MTWMKLRIIERIGKLEKPSEMNDGHIIEQLNIKDEREYSF